MPPGLRASIEEEAAAIPGRDLSDAAEQLSRQYRSGALPGRALSGRAAQAAYLATRMPAIYAVVVAVLEELRARCGDLAPASLLDLGAGSGAASWAACHVFDSLQAITLVEREAGMVDTGRRLAAGRRPEGAWQVADLCGVSRWLDHDLVILSYVIGELPQPAAARVVGQAWSAARQALVIVEPGTPAGFTRILEARASLLAAGAHLAAPCPHSGPCPVVPPDWCHFAQRIERTALHRRLKHGEKGFEDEKYSYLAVTRVKPEPARNRIVRHPKHEPNRITLQLCTPEGLKSAPIRRSDREAFRAARKSGWGSPWEP